MKRIGLYDCDMTNLFPWWCSWALILGAALVSIMVLGPILISFDRRDVRRAIIESKGMAMSYITSWSGGDAGEQDELEIGDDEDIDYDDYKDLEPGEKGVIDREKHKDEDDVEKTDGTSKGNDTSVESKGKRSFLSALKSCTDMVCVREAHELPKEDAEFNFPHFLIIGFQKAATTSLHVYVLLEVN